jgi:aminopeptidase YwaD
MEFADQNILTQKAQDYLDHLCLEIPTRRVGSQGNREATDFFAKTVSDFGFQTQCPEFDCMD